MPRASATSLRLLFRSIIVSRLRPLSEALQAVQLADLALEPHVARLVVEHVKREPCHSRVQLRVDLAPPLVTSHRLPGGEVLRLLTVERHELGLVRDAPCLLRLTSLGLSRPALDFVILARGDRTRVRVPLILSLQ
jgi:hypothetical protein